MSKTLYSYILKNYIKSKYAKTILNSNSLVDEMFIDIGKKFDLDEPYIDDDSSEDIYFYDVKLIDGSKKLAYIGYNTEKYASIYIDEDMKLYSLNYMTRKLSPITIDLLDANQLEKYNSIISSIKDIKNKQYNLLCVLNDVKYYYDCCGSFYDVNRKQITEDLQVYYVCSMLYENLKKELTPIQG